VQKRRKEREKCEEKEKKIKKRKESITLMVAKVKKLNLDLMSKDIEVKFGEII
jgi:hypothetical protein